MSLVLEHEAYVAKRFDLLQSRFKRGIQDDDFRVRALVDALEPLAGLRVLDLGCGKGRFASKLQEAGADVVGLDLSSRMLAEARGIDRVRASGRQLPFKTSVFDVVVAVEVFEHMTGIDDVVSEVARVLQPGGKLLVIDKNAGSWNDRRPYLPNLLIKRIDELRGRWMYPARAPVRERWFWPEAFRARLRQHFARVEIVYLLSPLEQSSSLFRLAPRARLMTLWTASKSGEVHD